LLLNYDALAVDLPIFAARCHKWPLPGVILIMNRNKRRIICTWILLLCFAAGQWAVYAHQHKVFAGTAKSATQRTIVSENCRLCDAMHHNNMMMSTYTYFSPVITTTHFYKQGQYDFINISLVLSSGRAPPVA
jgi:hypothetical protein